MAEQLSSAISAELRAQLQLRRAALRREIAALRRAEDAGPPEDALLPDDVPDRADIGSDFAERERERANELPLRGRLAEIDHALAKFDAGTYGRCERCGRPIPIARLRALPEARYDLAHQAGAEAPIAGHPPA